MWLNQFSGCFALMNYTANIFKESGSNMSPNESSIVVAFIQLLGSYAATFLVDKCGRKILMIISTLFTSFGYCAVATYSYLNHAGLDVSGLKWIPVLSLSLVIFVASLGILTLPFVILPEVIPQKIRNVASTFCVMSVTFNAFIVIKVISNGHFKFQNNNHTILIPALSNNDRENRTSWNYVDIFDHLHVWHLHNCSFLTRNQRKKFGSRN
jgi:hypothetical protein